MTSLRNTLPLPLAVLALIASGCAGPRLGDTIDFEFDFSPFTGPAHSLHSPYVAGADFDVYAIGVDDEEGWRITTSDPAMLHVDSGGLDGDAAAVTATGAGAVDLILTNDRDREVHRAPVDVLAADRADLIAHGPLILERPELQPETTEEIQVLVGGSGTFLVEWFAGEEQLSGHGALSVETDPGATAAPRRTFLFEDREWLTVSALEAGRHEIRLMANGALVRTITVIGVDETAIDQVQIHGMDETGARDGDPLTAYAQAYAADGTPIYGVEYEWDLDGAAQDGLGDLYRYEFERGHDRMLCARHGTTEAFATIQAARGWVDSTNELGCSASPSASGGALAALPVLAPFVLVWRRRRRG